MDEPSKLMRAEAASVGHYIAPFGGAKYPRMQIITVEDLLAGKGIQIPPHERVSSIGKKAPKVKRPQAVESDLF